MPLFITAIILYFVNQAYLYNSEVEALGFELQLVGLYVCILPAAHFFDAGYRGVEESDFLLDVCFHVQLSIDQVSVEVQVERQAEVAGHGDHVGGDAVVHQVHQLVVHVLHAWRQARNGDTRGGL
ncbi:hypothetical protein EGW08_021803, partial [Elysia chlorotica]